MSTSAGPVRRAGPAELSLWLVRRRLRFRVDGGSMVPTLVDGDYVLARVGGGVQVGDVVVARYPGRTGGVVVKRVAAVTAAGLDLRGDDPAASTDSRAWGPVDPADVLAVVTSRIG